MLISGTIYQFVKLCSLDTENFFFIIDFGFLQLFFLIIIYFLNYFIFLNIIDFKMI